MMWLLLLSLVWLISVYFSIRAHLMNFPGKLEAPFFAWAITSLFVGPAALVTALALGDYNREVFFLPPKVKKEKTGPGKITTAIRAFFGVRK